MLIQKTLPTLTNWSVSHICERLLRKFFFPAYNFESIRRRRGMLFEINEFKSQYLKNSKSSFGEASLLFKYKFYL